MSFRTLLQDNRNRPDSHEDRCLGVPWEWDAECLRFTCSVSRTRVGIMAMGCGATVRYYLSPVAAAGGSICSETVRVSDAMRTVYVTRELCVLDVGRASTRSCYVVRAPGSVRFAIHMT